MVVAPKYKEYPEAESTGVRSFGLIADAAIYVSNMCALYGAYLIVYNEVHDPCQTVCRLAATAEPLANETYIIASCTGG